MTPMLDRSAIEFYSESNFPDLNYRDTMSVLVTLESSLFVIPDMSSKQGFIDAVRKAISTIDPVTSSYSIAVLYQTHTAVTFEIRFFEKPLFGVEFIRDLAEIFKVTPHPLLYISFSLCPILSISSSSFVCSFSFIPLGL